MKQLFFICIIFMLASCEKAPPQTSLNKEQIAAEIKQMLTDYHADIEKDGLTAEFFYLDHSADFFWVPPGYSSALKYDTVRTILEQNSKALSAVKFQWDTLQIFPLSKEIANYTGIVVGQMIDTAGVESNMSIIESGTLIKRASGWKLLNGQSAVLENPTKN